MTGVVELDSSYHRMKNLTLLVILFDELAICYMECPIVKQDCVTDRLDMLEYARRLSKSQNSAVRRLTPARPIIIAPTAFVSYMPLTPSINSEYAS